MSWIVERLLIDRNSIRSEHSLESDTFNKLIFLEQKIGELYKSGYLSKKEMEVIELMSEGYSITEISKSSGRARSTIRNIFKNACNRISFHLGGYYTDQGFLQEMQDNYNLTDVEIEKVKDRISSKYRHVIPNNRSDI